MTFADFAITEARFRKHFRIAPRTRGTRTWCPWPSSSSSTRGRPRGTSSRTSGPSTRSTSSAPRRQRQSWSRAARTGLLGHAPGHRRAPRRRADAGGRRGKVRGGHRVQLMQLATASAPRHHGRHQRGRHRAPEPPAAAPAGEPGACGGVGGATSRPWIDTEDCTSCDECININPKMFAYNDDKKAFIKDVNAGSYKDLVKAAEKCTAQVIHPGLPKDRAPRTSTSGSSAREKYN
jgi:pyruvate-ferredoxin/flavodoxin oxidoreductase